MLLAAAHESLTAMSGDDQMRSQLLNADYMDGSKMFQRSLMLTLADAGKYARASPPGNGRWKNDAKPSLRDKGKNARKLRRASWMNGKCVKPV
jgi:hypothetical protein